MFSRKKSASAAAAPLPGSAEAHADILRCLDRALKNPLKANGTSGDSAELRRTLRAIEASFYLIDQVRETVVEACHIVLRANAIDDLGGRALLAEQYDELRQTIQRQVEGAEADALDLVGPAARGLTASLSQTSSYTVFPARLDIAIAGVDLPPPGEGFAETQEIADILEKLDRALDRLDRVSALYMKDVQFLMGRLTRLAG